MEGGVTHLQHTSSPFAMPLIIIVIQTAIIPILVITLTNSATNILYTRHSHIRDLIFSCKYF